MRVLSLFSGIGAYEKALTNIGVPHEIVGFSEINPRAITAYSVLHGVDQQKNIGDITGVDPLMLPEFDLLTYSPPCQDISIAGQHAGVGGNTRSGLIDAVIPIIKAKQPTYAISENVWTLATKYRAVLDAHISALEHLGYTCTYAVLNAMDYGLPQNRKRIYIVSTRDTKPFQMPEPVPLFISLKKLLRARTIDRDIAYTIRLGGRKSKIGNKHNWDGYMVNGEPYYLTAEDCMRLMGFAKSDYQKLHKAGLIDSAICKLAGNSVVVPVLDCIFRNLLTQST